MNALPTHVKMADHVQMELIVLPARVSLVFLDTTVSQVSIYFLTILVNKCK